MSSIEMGCYSFNTPEEKLSDYEEEIVETSRCNVKVSIYGNKKNQAIVTFHDIGLDANGNFQNFFQFGTVTELCETFCVYNINAPGQEGDAKPLPIDYSYPSMDGLADIVEDVVKHFGIKSFIGFGIGAGANVLLRYAVKRQEKMEALVLINATSQKAGWIEWGYEKVNIRSLRSTGMNNFVADYLTWHHFGKRLDEVSGEVLHSYRNVFLTHPNPGNLALFLEAFLNRTEVVVQRPGDGASTTLNQPILKIPVLQLVGARSGFIEESVDLSSKLNPAHSEWIKVSDSCGLVLDDKPDKVTESLLLFFQGLGYFTRLNVRNVVDKLAASYDSYGRSNNCAIQAVNEQDF